MSKIPAVQLKDPAGFEAQVMRTVNGNLEWGLNFKSTIPTVVVTPGVADTEFSLDHNLGFVPNGYIVISKDIYCDVRKGATAWTTSKIYLKCSIATVTLTLVVC